MPLTFMLALKLWKEKTDFDAAATNFFEYYTTVGIELNEQKLKKQKYP